MSKIDFKNLRESYKFTCAQCGFEQNAKPSLAMQAFHENSGAGSCLECKTFLHLKIADDGTRMESMIWEDHLKAKKHSQTRKIRWS